jgi:hypothetical protein
MWHKDNYRIIFRHEMYPSDERIESAIETMLRRGGLEFPVHDGVVRDTYAMSAVVLQKKITQDGISAWATLGCGYSFCQMEDNFCKRDGRKYAFDRAIKQVKWSECRQVFQDMWNENQPKVEVKDE